MGFKLLNHLILSVFLISTWSFAAVDPRCPKALSLLVLDKEAESFLENLSLEKVLQSEEFRLEQNGNFLKAIEEGKTKEEAERLRELDLYAKDALSPNYPPFVYERFLDDGVVKFDYTRRKGNYHVLDVYIARVYELDDPMFGEVMIEFRQEKGARYISAPSFDRGLSADFRDSVQELKRFLPVFLSPSFLKLVALLRFSKSPPLIMLFENGLELSVKNNKNQEFTIELSSSIRNARSLVRIWFKKLDPEAIQRELTFFKEKEANELLEKNILNRKKSDLAEASGNGIWDRSTPALTFRANSEVKIENDRSELIFSSDLKPKFLIVDDVKILVHGLERGEFSGMRLDTKEFVSGKFKPFTLTHESGIELDMLKVSLNLASNQQSTGGHHGCPHHDPSHDNDCH